MSGARHYDAVVLGGGAAGLMCAIEAGKRGRRVAVLEHSQQIGRKILISGGGRCNFTNVHCRPEHFFSANPHFAKSALARYTPSDFIRLVEHHRIPYHEKKLGQMFCNRTASDVTGMLLAECRAAGVEVVVKCMVEEVRQTAGFHIRTSQGDFLGSALVIATGGLSIPKIGATDLGYRLAGQFGVAVQRCRPGLVAFTFSPTDVERYSGLSGVSTEVVVSFGPAHFRENMLFTHRGVSGPAMLQLSSYWDGRSPITVDLLPGVDIAGRFVSARAGGERAESKTVLAGYLPKRLADRWFDLHSPPGARGPLHSCREADLRDAAARLHAWQLLPAGTDGYAKAEVTAGGVDTSELSSRTMEARKVRGLFFIGEVVDVTGWLGGFNFQWAWASGYAAGQAL